MVSIFIAFSALLIIQCFVFLIWWIAYQIQKTSVIDIFWSLFVLFSAIFYFYLFSPGTSISWVYLILVSLWSLRLAGYIYFRSLEKGEDERYKTLREGWGNSERRKMLLFYFKQGLAAWFFGLPFFIMFANPIDTFGVWQFLGIILWIIAFYGETTSDLKLMAFKSHAWSKSRVCRAGMWKYSRHPNYFFEWLNWVAFAWLVFPHFAGFWAIACPVLMYYFLNHISGIPLSEDRALESRSREYIEYQRITPPFFPGTPKKSDYFDEPA